MLDRSESADQESRPVPDTFTEWRNVIDLRDERITLHYNCFYMTNICENYGRFRATDRGQNLHPGTTIPANTYTYDFDSADDRPVKSRKNARRDHSCPSTWKSTHTCPEDGQKAVWRHDGQWWTMDLEPDTTSNMLQHQRDGDGQIIQLSGLRYTCDEHPSGSFTRVLP